MKVNVKCLMKYLTLDVLLVKVIVRRYYLVKIVVEK